MMMQFRYLLTLGLVATLGIAASACGNSKSKKSTDSVGGATANTEQATTQSCARWTGKATEPANSAQINTTPVTAMVDLDSEVGKSLLGELQAELDASMPQFATCGLRADDLRSVRFVINHAGVKQGRIIGLPPLAKLLQCPFVPNIVEMAKTKGWVIEDGGDGELLVRQESASPLPSNVLDFATPEGHWLYARASAGPSDRRVTATLRDDPE
ncbi:MAG: hypothetical protein GY811_06920, partial [Myxococcales bacterium]|nr:hypothetical protein [Myxococcales bacterium]